MAKPSEKLAESLEAMHALQERGVAAIRSGDLTRTHRERLRRNGFLQEVIKGWYVPARPDEAAGESTAWYAAFWHFCATYLQHRFGIAWCLSPEQSLSLHAENWAVPRQLLVRSSRAHNNITTLPHDTSLLDIRASIPEDKDIETKDGLRLFSLPAALIACAPGYFRQNPTDMRTALSMVRDASEVLDQLLEGGHSTIAGRLAGAFRNIGRNRIADDIVQTMRAAGYDIRENDPFETQVPVMLSAREQSPYVNRIRLMWQEMRGPIIERFPKAPGLPKDTEAYLKRVEDVYVTDAYHSLSIEGYRVNPELIERVRSGNWNPDGDKGDRDYRNALAARGYWQAYQAVCKSIGKIMQSENPATVADDDHRTWYREMFAPGVTAGLLRPADLAGYRNGPVYIRRSMHVPPSREAVRDTMPAFFDLLREETEPSVRIVLGHFIFVYIHPYIDGNGRMGRFLMNVMLAGSGYPWTVIPLQERDAYMAALEEASVRQDIVPFANFLAHLVEAGLKGKPDLEYPLSI
ncbi:MAG: Fic family protein [Gammaproteobacteria bacterium]